MRPVVVETMAAMLNAGYYLENTAQDGVTPWDYDAPESGPLSRSQVDTSACAIAASGLLDLADAAPDGVTARAYRDFALTSLRTLSEKYLGGLTPGFEGILNGGVYHIHKNLGVHEAVMFGEYFFVEALDKALAVLHLDRSFTERQLNVGFSGGERKRAEVLQMLLLQPVIALLDETDSGLDIDSLGIVAKAIDALVKQGAGVLIVTHYNRIFEQVRPDVVHVMLKGRIATSGDAHLVKELEHKGYGWLKPGALKVV